MSSAPAPVQMEDTALRLKIREYARRNRNDLRTDTRDALRFGLGQIKDKIRELENLGVKDVQGMGVRIKRRKHATAEDMYRLSHAFLQSNENINAFAEIPGATQVIIKELTGSQVHRQNEAAECLCNLSLGEAHVCEKITTLAGSYLVTFLDSQEARLTRSCLWTLANIIDTCKKSTKILLQMQLASKLWKLYTTDPISNINGHQEDAGICLYLIATKAASLVTVEDRQYIAKHLHEKQATDPASIYYMYLVLQFEICRLERDLCVPHFQHIFNFFMANLSSDYITPVDQLSTACGVCVVSNIFAALPFVGKLEFQPEQIVNALNQLFAIRNSGLNSDLLQLVKNITNSQLMANDRLLEQLRVYA